MIKTLWFLHNTTPSPQFKAGSSNQDPLFYSFLTGRLRGTRIKSIRWYKKSVPRNLRMGKQDYQNRVVPHGKVTGKEHSFKYTAWIDRLYLSLDISWFLFWAWASSCRRRWEPIIFRRVRSEKKDSRVEWLERHRDKFLHSTNLSRLMTK